LNNLNYIDHYKKDAVEFDYFEENKGATAHDERRVHEYIISKVPKEINTILDVGCGKGWVAKHFLPKGAKVNSLDVSTSNPARAMELYPSENHAGIAADSFKIPFVDDSFDVVIASEIIEHVVDPVEFIKELFRVVRKGGRLLVTTPYKKKLIYYLCVHCNKKTPANAHIHSFDEKKWRVIIMGKILKNLSIKLFGINRK